MEFRDLPEVPRPCTRAERRGDRGDDVRAQEGEGEPRHRSFPHPHQDTALPSDTYSGR